MQISLSTKDEKKLKVKLEVASGFIDKRKKRPVSGYLSAQVKLIRAVAVRIIQH